ncbi:MAG: CIA30 family protein [Sandarakinorhabdus sp.]|nr:CIA30 family protein [Sandarakinorhabdus sp.]
MIETFADNPADRWRFFTDQVMGGVSSGTLHFDHDNNRSWARITGMISTANNGGFIQMQRLLEAPLPSGLTGVRLIARGNDQRYFIHLRRTGAASPTAFYRAGFDVTSKWCATRLPFALFTASKGGMPALLEGSNLASVGIVAYGRNHHADICISEIGFY